MIKKIKNWFVSFINNWKRVNKELEELENQDLEEKSKTNAFCKSYSRILSLDEQKLSTYE